MIRLIALHLAGQTIRLLQLNDLLVLEPLEYQGNLTKPEQGARKRQVPN
jgi:hypothetical protein